MEENSLLPLSHTTHTNSSHNTLRAHTGPHVQDSLPEDSMDDGTDGEPRPSETASLEERVRQEFNFSDFYSLANRILDGDEGSLNKLLDLKNRWERRFPDPVPGRRFLNRFLTKLSFLPRRSVHMPPHPADSPKLDVGDDDNRATSNDPTPQPHSEETSASQELQEQRHDPPPSMDNPSIPEVFVGNVKLSMLANDNIAEGFLQSSRKTLRYIPPMTQHDEIIIKPTPDMVAKGASRWQTTAVGYFLGRRPYFPQLEAFARANWRGLLQVSATANGFFFFRFKTVAYMEGVIEGGPWLFQGQPMVLQAWEQGMSLRRQKHTQVSVWVRIRHLPMEYWTEEGLSVVASGIGIPLYTDSITQQCLRLDFARVCVMLHFTSKLPKHLVVLRPRLPEGTEVPIKVDIEYEWLPLRCKQCSSLGHTANACPEIMVKKPSAPVSVFVQKGQSTMGEHTRVTKEVVATCAYVEADVEPRQSPCNSGQNLNNVAATLTTPSVNIPDSTLTGLDQIRTNKGKEIVVFNSFPVLDSEGGDLEENWEPMRGTQHTGPRSSPPALPL
ncbi:UNVERIFIED_CONTAM: hypothetical protein Sradi_7102300 [Sesamum radiatum]|uniref:DUF4283 domain-containing protein n=1 Tax=Sesamum radiatum TaxID=300843 RepID=A0AAW2J413_SESRA